MREVTAFRTSATIAPMPKKARARFALGRLDAAIERAGFKNDLAFSKAARVSPSQVKRWRDQITTPEGANFARVCAVLGVMPGYLFGVDLDEEERRRQLAHLVRNNLGQAEADMLTALASVPEKHRGRVVAAVLGFAWPSIADASPIQEGAPQLLAHSATVEKKKINARLDRLSAPELAPLKVEPPELELPPDQPARKPRR